MLTLARADSEPAQKTVKTNLAKEIKKELRALEPRLKNKKIKTQLKNAEIVINKTDFLSIFNILVDNAIKYSDESIEVHLTDGRLVIMNDGAKIKSDEIEHIFERFYQTDKTADGVGLGLAIAKSIAERNHWEINARSAEKTNFTLRW